MKRMRGDTTAAERFQRHMVRLSARQRIVVLTFDTVAEAEAWDAAPDQVALAGLIEIERGIIEIERDET